MKLIVESDVLISCLAMVGGAVVEKTTVPIMTGVRISVQGKGVTLDTFNYSGESRQILFTADVETADGACVVNHKQFTAIIGKLNGRVTLATVGNNKLSIKNGDYSGNLSTYPLDEWYAPEQKDNGVDGEGGFTLGLADPTILSLVGLAASSDESRPTLTNILLRVANPTPPVVNDYLVAATDGYRLTVYQEGTVGDNKVEMLIPRNVSMSIAKIAATLKAKVAITINGNYSRGMVVFTETTSPIQWAKLLFSTSLDRFPDYQAIIPNDNAAVVTMLCSPVALVHALDRALTMADGIARVMLTLSETKIKIERESESGTSSETVPLLTDKDRGFEDTNETTIVMGMSGKYFIDGLSIFSKPVTMRATQPMRPLKLSEGKWVHVVMPMAF